MAHPQQALAMALLQQGRGAAPARGGVRHPPLPRPTCLDHCKAKAPAFLILVCVLTVVAGLVVKALTAEPDTSALVLGLHRLRGKEAPDFTPGPEGVD